MKEQSKNGQVPEHLGWWTAGLWSTRTDGGCWWNRKYLQTQERYRFEGWGDEMKVEDRKRSDKGRKTKFQAATPLANIPHIHTCSSSLEELEQCVDADGGDQGSPAAACRELIHCKHTHLLLYNDHHNLRFTKKRKIILSGWTCTKLKFQRLPCSVSGCPRGFKKY